MTFIYYFFIALFMLLCVLMSGVILIQESKSMGLGSSFGGDSSDALFGSSTAQVLKKFTAVLATIFLVSCVLLSAWTSTLGLNQTKGPNVAIEETHDA